MGSALAKNLEQQFRSAIGYHVRFGKIWRAVHKNNQLHDAPYIVQVADGSLESREQLYGNIARCLLPLGCSNLLAEFTDPKFSIFFSETSGKVNQIASPDKRNESGNVTVHDWGLDLRQRDLQGFQALVNC